ncbi:MAG: hypothetical protein AAF170_17770 [Bacteroidota bacterium]
MAKNVTIAFNQGTIDSESALVRVYRSPDDTAWTEIGTSVVNTGNAADYVDLGPSDNGLADGTWYYRAAQEDSVPNLSAFGPSVSVTIDTTAPGAPSIATLTVGDFTP